MGYLSKKKKMKRRLLHFIIDGKDLEPLHVILDFVTRVLRSRYLNLPSFCLPETNAKLMYTPPPLIKTSKQMLRIHFCVTERLKVKGVKY